MSLSGSVGQFGELLRKIFGSHFAEEYSGLILVCIAILLLLLIVWFVYRKRPELFMVSHKNALPYTVEEDTIYGVDFPGGDCGSAFPSELPGSSTFALSANFETT